MKVPSRCGATLLGLAAGIFLVCSVAAQEKDGSAVSPTPEKQAPSLLLAKVWEPSINPTGWWMSEKYDGLRGYWDGRNLWTRQGNLIHAPDYFRAELPRDIALDGELWIGHGKFEETVSIVRSETPDVRWKRVHFMVFDAPQAKARSKSACSSCAPLCPTETTSLESSRKRAAKEPPNSSPSAIASFAAVVKESCCASQ